MVDLDRLTSTRRIGVDNERSIAQVLLYYAKTPENFRELRALWVQ